MSQEYDPGSTMIVDYRNMFNKLSHLIMLSAVQHCFSGGWGAITTIIGSINNVVD